jgi:hypothetical protein
VLLKHRLRLNVQIISAAIFAAAVMALLVSAYTFAATGDAVNTLKITPVRTDIEVEPGDTKVVKTTVTNQTDSAITVRAVINDFIAGDEEGNPSLILDEGEYARTHSLKRFMGNLQDIEIPAKQSKTVEATIIVPENAQAGGYFGAVRFAPTTPDSGGQVNMSASVASLILLTVPGDAVEKLDLASFDILQGGKNASYFNSSNDLQARVRFENKGNIHLGPIGKVSVKKGEKVVYETDFNNKDPRDMILPDSVRRWDVSLKNIGSFGKYTVSATFTYGKANQTVEVVRTFWVIPTIVVIAAVIIALLIIAIIVMTILGIRNRRKNSLFKGPRHTRR